MPHAYGGRNVNQPSPRPTPSHGRGGRRSRARVVGVGNKPPRYGLACLTLTTAETSFNPHPGPLPVMGEGADVAAHGSPAWEPRHGLAEGYLSGLGANEAFRAAAGSGQPGAGSQQERPRSRVSTMEESTYSMMNGDNGSTGLQPVLSQSLWPYRPKLREGAAGSQDERPRSRGSTMGVNTYSLMNGDSGSTGLQPVLSQSLWPYRSKLREGAADSQDERPRGRGSTMEESTYSTMYGDNGSTGLQPVLSPSL